MTEDGAVGSLIEDEDGAARGSGTDVGACMEDDGKSSGNVYFGGAGSTMLPKVDALGV